MGMLLSKLLASQSFNPPVYPDENLARGLVKLDQQGIRFFYHITHINNLANIMADGLYSHEKAHQHHQITDISNQSINAHRGFYLDSIFYRSLHSYVPCFFNPRNPMSYCLREMANELVILKISRKLLLRGNVIFTDGNAACRDTRFLCQLTDLQQLNWDCLNDKYWCHYVDGKRQRSAEMLVPDHIPVKSILQIVAKSHITYDKALEFCTPDCLVIKQPELFF